MDTLLTEIIGFYFNVEGGYSPNRAIALCYRFANLLPSLPPADRGLQLEYLPSLDEWFRIEKAAEPTRLADQLRSGGSS